VKRKARLSKPSLKRRAKVTEGEYLPAEASGSNSVLEVRYVDGKRRTVTSTQRNIKTVARKARKAGSLTHFLPAGSSEDFYQYNGKDLGFLAAQVRRKSAEAFLELGRMVNFASELWYEPWKSVGRKNKKRVKEAIAADANWNDFLAELGYSDFKRYRKQINQLVAIGKRYDALKTYLDRLPDSQSALYTLVNKADKDRDFASLLERCSSDFTAADVKKLFPKNTSYEPPLRISIPLAEADEVENALLFAVALHLGKKNKPDLQTVAFDGLVKMLKKFRKPKSRLNDQSLFRFTKKFTESDELKNLMTLYQKLSKEKNKQDFQDWKTLDEPRFGSIGKLYGTKKKRDFSNLKV
jgi:hypothetical protein